MILDYEEHESGRYPVVAAYRVRVLAGVSPFWSALAGKAVEVEACEYLEIDCPFCGDRHRHGGGEKPGHANGGRVPHCSGGVERYERAARQGLAFHYILREVGRMADERLPAARRRRSLSARPRPAISPRTRARVLERDHFRCRRCGSGPNDDRLVVDHVVPVAAGGKTEDGNLQTLCETCNLGKSDRPPHAHDLRAFT